MYDQKLIEVIDHFQLTNIGLTVAPDFSIPENGKWNDYHTEVKVITPNGHESIHKVHIGSWHFNIRDPEVSIDKRWRIILSFPESNKEQIPIGSEIYATKQDYTNITGEKA